MVDFDETDIPPARPAATLVVFREAGAKPADLLFVERAATMAFAGGAVVFPGGALDPRDESYAQALGCADVSEAAHRICAIRETMEESGIAVGFRDQPDRAWCETAQKALHNGADFADLLEEARLALDLSALMPFAHWRPKHHERRVFDTRFYIARAHDGEGDPLVDATENVLSYWASAEKMITAADEGRTKVIFPTRRNLEKLALCPTFDSALIHIEQFPPRMVSPWQELREGEPWLCIPDDLGYPITAEPLRLMTRG